MALILARAQLALQCEGFPKGIQDERKENLSGKERSNRERQANRRRKEWKRSIID